MARDRRGSAAKYHMVVDEAKANPHQLALDLTGRNRRVLELGCAAGHVSTALKARGHYVVGVEIDPDSAEKARSIADEVVTADLDAVSLTEVVTTRNFDVALMGDVLEHLRDPLTVLQEVAGMLTPDGFAVLSIPNVAFADVRMALLDGDWTYRSDGLLDNTHLRFFTRASLFRFARDAGFVVTELRRQLRPPGTSNVAVSPGTISGAVRDLLQLDPNADTYVFVVKLERATAANSAVADALDAQLDASEADAARQIQELVRTRADELPVLNAARQELLALKNTKTMRALALPRRWYARARRVMRRSR